MRWPENAVFPLIITAEGLSNVPQMTVTCQNDPAILRGIRATPGDLLLGEHIALSDSEFQTNGQWQLTGIQINPAPSLPNTGVLWYLDYQVIAVGVTSLVCWIQLVEHTGQSLPVTITSDEMIIEGYRDETAVPPTVEIMHLSGSVVSSLPLEQATVTISRTAMQESTAMASDGTFAFDVPPGDYQLTVTASHHLPVVVEVVISEQLLALPTIMLTGGDVDGNEVIDIGDVNLIVQYYGFTVPPASSSLDLNGDAVIDLLDLTIVSANLSSTLHINE